MSPKLAGGFLTTPPPGKPDLVVYPFYIYQFASANPKLPLQHSPTPLPLGNHQSNHYVPDSVQQLLKCGPGTLGSPQDFVWGSKR